MRARSIWCASCAAAAIALSLVVGGVVYYLSWPERNVPGPALSLVAIVVLSGVLGAILYITVPRLLTEVESNLTIVEISEQLNQLGDLPAFRIGRHVVPCQTSWHQNGPRARIGTRTVSGRLIASACRRLSLAGDWPGALTRRTTLSVASLRLSNGPGRLTS